MEGKMLVAFVALIIRNQMYTKLKDEEEKLLSKPNFMNVPAAIRELEKIEMIRQADGIYRLEEQPIADTILPRKAVKFSDFLGRIVSAMGGPVNRRLNDYIFYHN